MRAGILTCALLGLVIGCGSPRPPEPAALGAAPDVQFRTLEDRLLGARVVRLAFQITSEGAFVADLRGELEVVAASGEIRLTATGDFGGQPADLGLRSDGQELEVGNGSNRKTMPAPAELKEALLIGLTRMGILHNLARLTAAAPPDHAEGGVREWVVVDSFAVDTLDRAAIDFEITVAGKPSGSASLAIDSRGGPVARRQTVRFAEGEMRVVERYSAVAIDP